MRNTSSDTLTEASLAIINVVLKDFINMDNEKLARLVSSPYSMENGNRYVSSTERILLACLNIFDSAYENIPFSNSSHLMSISKSISKFGLLLIAISFTSLKTTVQKVQELFKSREVNMSETKIIDLPEDCIGELQALEKRWRKQNLTDEEIQANIEFFKRDMQIGQRDMKRDEIKHKAWSLFMKIILQLGESLSI